MRANVKPRPNVYGQNEKSIVRCISDASGSYVRHFDVLHADTESSVISTEDRTGYRTFFKKKSTDLS